MFDNLFKWFRTPIKSADSVQPPKSDVVADNCDIPLLLTLEGYKPA